MSTDQERIEELEARVEELEEVNSGLEDANYALEDELLELRGPVPYFPPANLVNDPKQYIAVFNTNRHLKETPQ